MNILKTTIAALALTTAITSSAYAGSNSAVGDMSATVQSNVSITKFKTMAFDTIAPGQTSNATGIFTTSGSGSFTVSVDQNATMATNPFAGGPVGQFNVELGFAEPNKTYNAGENVYVVGVARLGDNQQAGEYKGEYTVTVNF